MNYPLAPTPFYRLLTYSCDELGYSDAVAKSCFHASDIQLLSYVHRFLESSQFHEGTPGPIGPLEGINRESIRKSRISITKHEFALYGSWEALVVCEILQQGPATISTPGKPANPFPRNHVLSLFDEISPLRHLTS